MKEFENNAYFWQKVDAVYMSGDYKTLYTKGMVHPKYPELIFPCDYGHIYNGDISLKVFKGTNGKKVQSIVVCMNVLGKDLHNIVLVGLNEQEEEDVLKFLNFNENQKSIIVRRGNNIPSWAVIE